MLCAFLATWLTSCAHSTDVLRPSLPEAQPDLVACMEQPIVMLPDGSWSRAQATQIIGDLRRSEIFKDKCATAWGNFYTDLRKQLRTSR